MAEQKKYLNLNGLGYFVRKINEIKANIQSPAFTGTPTTPTPTGENDKQIVNVEYLKSEIKEMQEYIDYLKERILYMPEVDNEETKEENN